MKKHFQVKDFLSIKEYCIRKFRNLVNSVLYIKKKLNFRIYPQNGCKLKTDLWMSGNMRTSTLAFESIDINCIGNYIFKVQNPKEAKTLTFTINIPSKLFLFKL